MISCRSFVLVMLLIFSGYGSFSQNTSWTKDAFSVQIKNREVIVTYNKKILVDISSVNFNFQQAASLVISQKNTDSVVLHCIYPPFAKYNNETGALTADISISVDNNSLHFKAKPDWAKNTTIILKDNNEHYFGIAEQLQPDNSKDPDLRGKTIDIDPIGNGEQFHENYASVWSAFYMTNKGYASFFDSFSEGKYSLGINGITELYHHTGNLDWYIIPGNNGDAILKNYYSIIGKPKFVPLWACGVTGWRDENKGGKEEILDDIRQMTGLKIPFTAWMVDRPYSEGANNWSKMNFNAKFSDPGKWISEINNKYGLQFLTWAAPMVFEDKDFPALLPNYKGYIDLTDPQGLKEFEKRLKENQYNVNVRGHKMDRADEDFPEASAWYDKTPAPERRAKYLYLYSKTINDFLQHAYGDDVFNYARGAYHRCQPFLSAVWGGDSRSTWDGLRGNVANCIRTGFMGFPVWGSDVGGYLGGMISEKLYARWLEFGALSGLFEIKIDDAGGRGEDRAPWKYSKKLQDIFKGYCDMRMTLQPYIFSITNTSYKNGVAMKPLAYCYPDDVNTYKLWDEYLFGNAFLVAPILDSTDKRTVYLPAGEWYDLYDHSKMYKGHQSITVTQPEEIIPLFIKANSIVVEGKMIRGNSKNWDSTGNDLQCYYFSPTGNGRAVFDYVDYFDSNKEKQITASKQGNQVAIDKPAIVNANTFIVKLFAKPKQVFVDDKHIDINWNEHKKVLIIGLPANRGNRIKILL